MSKINLFLKELNEQALVTRKMLEKVPADKFGWQPENRSIVPTLKRM